MATGGMPLSLLINAPWARKMRCEPSRPANSRAKGSGPFESRCIASDDFLKGSIVDLPLVRVVSALFSSPWVALGGLSSVIFCCNHRRCERPLYLHWGRGKTNETQPGDRRLSSLLPFPACTRAVPSTQPDTGEPPNQAAVP